MLRVLEMLRPLLCLALCSLFFLTGCENFEGQKILSWTDPDTGVRLEVSSQLYGGKTRVHMQVWRNGKTNRQTLADRLELNHASLVRLNDWVLVLGGPYVLGGYDLKNDKIVGVNSDALPFTVRNVSGYVVDSKTIGDGADVPPLDFKERRDPRD